ncbi:NTF2 and RRM domain containing protein [Pyrenophora tritici-repentis]|nr:ntf2 and rrm domain-containing protein [Pyrenophora tritici-repentis]KAI1549016.1 NTF2 and RRM domain containing protein [Pyrenophora tritici-repentis]KAI1558538.1 NTF2 and RRM domain containing protein [Pyrenophora tritici-repentis]KAI1579022.1 NTF2 and RRM domain containing protein [Pyrenophora tritici-repentis]KAI1580787.1 NTF2 and RRM domain containing protein [Pyrenophora tritici-repentis]
MASTEPSGPVNGNYAPQAYENSYSTGASNFTPSQQPTASQPAQQAAASEIPKDEVGWYFVEQYYTTLSKNPNQLYLFYNKRSQYVSGVEEDKVNVCQGQKAINERIKELDFKDTKVRVTNVDSQGSDANIVIQVIGEISNQGQPHKRFVQTFVLAEQTNGYFVLNDIFPPTAAVPEDADLNKSDEVATSEEDLNKVDEKLQEAAQEEPAVPEVAPAAPAQQVPEEVELPAAEEAPAAVEEKTVEEPKAPVEETVEAEKPAAPTPAPAAQKAAPVAMPSAPPKPSAPRTWASLAASAHKVATPVVNAPASQQAPTTGHKKEQSRAQNAGPAADPDQKRAYIKNVYSQVEDGALKAALSKFGEVEYLDISRGKNCAFVDFKTPAGFQAAVAANPHTINGIEIKVEERRTNPGQFNRGGFGRGGAPRGRGGMGQTPRGNFPPRGRGGPMRGGRGGAPQEA